MKILILFLLCFSIVKSQHLDMRQYLKLKPGNNVTIKFKDIDQVDLIDEIDKWYLSKTEFNHTNFKLEDVVRRTRIRAGFILKNDMTIKCDCEYVRPTGKFSSEEAYIVDTTITFKQGEQFGGSLLISKYVKSDNNGVILVEGYQVGALFYAPIITTPELIKANFSCVYQQLKLELYEHLKLKFKEKYIE